MAAEQSTAKSFGEANLSGTRLGRYQLLCPLAQGGMGTVYAARAHGAGGFSRRVAIKFLNAGFTQDEAFVGMFLDEARIASQIHHSNVVAILDVAVSQPHGYFIVMEYVQGHHAGTLSKKRTTDEPLSVPIVSRIVSDALAGLNAAHNLCDDEGQPLGLIHRDVSPHNILVDIDGVAKLSDFGIAKANSRLTTTTNIGDFKGKLTYAAPEYLLDHKVDQRSDLFSMGTVLWEMLTGKRLFDSDTNSGKIGKLLNAKIPLVSEIDNALKPLDEVVSKALARDPEERFASAEDFAIALEEAAKHFGGLASHRLVAQKVKETAPELLARRDEAIREASERLPVSFERESETTASIRREMSEVMRASRERIDPWATDSNTPTRPEAALSASSQRMSGLAWRRSKLRKLALVGSVGIALVLAALAFLMIFRSTPDQPDAARSISTSLPEDDKASAGPGNVTTSVEGNVNHGNALKSPEVDNLATKAVTDETPDDGKRKVLQPESNSGSKSVSQGVKNAKQVIAKDAKTEAKEAVQSKKSGNKTGDDTRPPGTTSSNALYDNPYR
ncbi:MAG: serine/threonine protein kinase [Myxococcales bacterium]|nr:MAG: serine/threonine protein kinase [Myxococcales bacterium]